MAVASPEVGHVTAAIGGGSGEEAPLEDVPAVAGKEEPPAERVPAIEVDGKEAAPVEWERLVPAIAVDRMEEPSKEGEEEEMVESEKEEVEAEDADEKEEEEDGEEEAEEEHEEEEKEEGEEEMVEAEEEDEEDEEEEEEEEEDVKWLRHYSSRQSILIVGDGDFSFSRALAIAFCSGANLVATSLDSYGLFNRFVYLFNCFRFLLRHVKMPSLFLHTMNLDYAFLAFCALEMEIRGIVH